MKFRYLTGSICVGALIAWQAFSVHTWGAETVQGNIAGLTVIASVVFMVVFSREPWWRSWFGISLMLIAVALFAGSLATVLFRRFGDYPWRDVLLVGSADLALAAMVIRTGVLLAARRDSKKKRLLEEQLH